jgi:GNAT superfamily N-acetyltransferase
LTRGVQSRTGVHSICQLVRFSENDHLDETLQVLLRVHAHNPTYPPREDVDGSPASLRNWLMAEDGQDRWVAMVDRVVAGHVQVVRAHDYLTTHLAASGFTPTSPNGVGEIVKLFVDPAQGARGIGTALLQRACTTAVERGMQPALAVVVTSRDAVRLYERSHLREFGSFMGVHGENLVFAQVTD